MSFNLSRLQNIAFQLNSMEQKIDDSIISKILSSLPEEYRYFSTAWESTPSDERNLSNLIARLLSGESRNNKTVSNESVAFK